jgi:hypothetical protein
MDDLQLDLDGYLPREKKPPHEERITIALLMLWTAMTAAVLGFDRAANFPNSGVLGVLPQLMAFVSAPLIGMGLSAWVLMLWRWYTDGPRFPSQPGHWLLLLFGFSSVVWIAQRAIVLVSLAGFQGFVLFLGINLIVELLALLLYVQAFLATRNRWRWLFGVGVCTTLLALLSTSTLGLAELRYQLHQLLAWVFCLCMLPLAIADLREGVRRDNLHWAGVIVIGGFLAYATVLPFVIAWVR